MKQSGFMAKQLAMQRALIEACRACGTGDAIDIIEDAPAADVVPIEALERLRDEMCAQDLITLEGLRRLNTLIWKYITVHDGGADHEVD